MIESPAVLILAWLLGGKRGGSERPRPPAGEKPKPVVEPPESGPWPRAVPKGGEAKMQQTGGTDIIAWRRSRYEAAVKFLSEDDRSIQALTDLVEHGAVEHGDYDIDDIALSVVAHWDIETASGTKEFNYNVGGVLALQGDQYFKALDVQSNKPVAFCAYDNLVQGIADYFGVLSYPKYENALPALLMLPGDPEWFSEMGWAGYYGMDPVKAAQLLDARRAMVAVDVRAAQ